MSSNLYEKKATKISLLNFSSAAMRAFHMSWLAFLSAFCLVRLCTADACDRR